MIKKHKKLFNAVLLAALFAILMSVVIWKTNFKYMFTMQNYVYDNGLDSTFELDFYKGSNIIPKTELKVPSVENETTSGGNAIVQSPDNTVRLTLLISKIGSLDITKKDLCQSPAFTYSQKGTNNQLPVCIASRSDETDQDIVYLSQLNSTGGNYLITIAQDYDVDKGPIDKNYAKQVLKDIGLNKHQAEIKYILSSISEK